MYHLYILRSQKTGRLYTGTTSDVRRRVRDHHLGNTPSTRRQGPWELVYLDVLPDRAAALEREQHLKSLTGGPEKFQLVDAATPQQRECWRRLVEDGG